MTSVKRVYLQTILNQLPRILGNLCRTPSMKTYGCFDRQYWNYSICDTPSARYQEGVLILALLYKINDPLNKYYEYPVFLEWIKAGINFWSSLQLSSGAFNDLYPNEQSYVATSFSLYAVTETILYLQDEMMISDDVCQAIHKAAEWLSNNPHSPVVNQECGAVLALYNSALILKKNKYQAVGLNILKNISSKQNKEGWFDEYGGPDIGYLSVSIDCLANYWQKTKNKTAKKMVLKAIQFLANFCHPDYTFGGEYGSRNTSYILPHGIEIFAHFDKTSAKVAAYLRTALFKNSSTGPQQLDNKYLIFNGYSYLQAFADGPKQLEILPSSKKAKYKYFPQSGLVILETDNFHLVLNLKKGALRLLFKKNKQVLCDSGILIKKENNEMFCSCWLNPKMKIFVSKSSFICRGHLVLPFDNRLTPGRNILFRLFQLTIGRWQKGAKWFKKQLRQQTILKQKATPIPFKRSINIKKEEIQIIDVVNMDGVFDVAVGGEMDSIYGESSRYSVNKGNILSRISLKNIKVNDKAFSLVRSYNYSGKGKIEVKEAKWQESY